MDKSTGEIVIVTGANKGIGYSVVEKLLAHNSSFQILLTSRDQKRGEEAISTLKKNYPKHSQKLKYHQLDVTSTKSISSLIQYLKENSHSVKILINNAGVGVKDDYYDPDYAASEEEIKFILGTNYYGLVNLTQEILPYLSKDGKVINVSSGLGSLSIQGDEIKEILSNSNWNLNKLNDFVNQFEKLAIQNKHREAGFHKSIYCCSKAFVNAYTRWVLVGLLKDDQTCFTIHPGWVKTDLGGPEASLSLEEGTVSTMHCVDLSLEDSKALNGRFFNFDAKLRDF